MPNLISQVAPLGQSNDYGLRASAVQYGLCESASDAIPKVAMCNNFTSDYLTEGSIVAIKFSNINSASVDTLTLNVNSTGAKPIKYLYNGALVNLPSADYLKANQVYIFYYDGTNWIILLSNDTNDVSSLDVTNSHPLLQWDTTSTIGSVNGTELTVTMPVAPVTKIKGDAENTYRTGQVNLTPANLGAATASHAHGNITNDGKVGETANYAVVTTTGGAVTAVSLKVDSPTASTTTSTTFIDTISQATNGKITATKKTLPSATTSVAGIVQLSSATNSTSTSLAATASAVKSAYDLANGAIPKSIGTAAGDLIYFSGASTPARLAKGTEGQVLKINSSGVPAWGDDDNYITVKFWS